MNRTPAQPILTADEKDARLNAVEQALDKVGRDLKELGTDLRALQAKKVSGK